MSSRGEFNWIQAIAKIIEGRALNVHSQSFNVKKTSKLSANTQTVEQDIFPIERRSFSILFTWLVEGEDYGVKSKKVWDNLLVENNNM